MVRISGKLILGCPCNGRRIILEIYNPRFALSLMGSSCIAFEKSKLAWKVATSKISNKTLGQKVKTFYGGDQITNKK